MYCACVSQVDTLVLCNEDAHTQNGEQQPVFVVESKQESCIVDFPVPVFASEDITKKISQMKQQMQIQQFPINLANATTVHKLQGQSLEQLVVFVFDPQD